MSGDGPVRKNRAHWDRASDEYQRVHGAELEATARAWGVWRVPEAELRVLGDLAGRDVLELGCGAAQWSAALRGSGARVVGLDLSRRQLAHAQARCGRLALDLSLVQASAEQLPLASECFDVVFSDHGATTFARPERLVPEVARVLRPGGRFGFAMSSPLRDICWSEARDAVSSKLERDYFGMSRIEDVDEVCFQLPYGEWIALFRRSGLAVEALHELRPPDGAQTSYPDFVPLEWARRWPAENIWELHKPAK